MSNFVRLTSERTPSAMARLWRSLQAYWVENPNVLIMGVWPHLAYRSAPGLQWRKCLEQRNARSE
jgi:hypothetical protein